MLQKLKTGHGRTIEDYNDMPKNLTIDLPKRAESLNKTEKISLPEIHMYHQMKAYGAPSQASSTGGKNLVDELVAQGLHMQFQQNQ